MAPKDSWFRHSQIPSKVQKSMATIWTSDCFPGGNMYVGTFWVIVYIYIFSANGFVSESRCMRKIKECFTESAKPGPRKPVHKYFCFLGSECGGGVWFRLEDIKANASYFGKIREILKISSLWNYWDTVFPSERFTIFLCFASSGLETSLAHCLSVSSAHSVYEEYSAAFIHCSHISILEE